MYVYICKCNQIQCTYYLNHGNSIYAKNVPIFSNDCSDFKCNFLSKITEKLQKS